MLGHHQVKRLALVFVLAAAQASTANAKTPALGQRIYLLDPHQPHAPTIIEATETAAEENYMRDPVIGKAEVAVETEKKIKRIQKRMEEEAPRYSPTKHRFPRFGVRGRHTRPRVEFDRRVLSVGPMDEPVGLDFLQKSLLNQDSSTF